jgi:hypothetical protein
MLVDSKASACTMASAFAIRVGQEQTVLRRPTFSLVSIASKLLLMEHSRLSTSIEKESIRERDGR